VEFVATLFMKFGLDFWSRVGGGVFFGVLSIFADPHPSQISIWSLKPDKKLPTGFPPIYLIRLSYECLWKRALKK
jgi:hypothetical protein